MTSDTWTAVPTLSLAVADWVSAGIINGRWTEGDRLREIEISDELNISRAPVREAFRILDQRGLATVRARSGAVVNRFSTSTILEVYAVRSALESWITLNSVPNLTANGLAALEEQLAIMRQINRVPDQAAFFDASWTFRRHLFSGYDNLTAWQVVATLRSRLHSLPQVLRQEQSHIDHTLEANESLMSLARGREAERAAEVLRRFLLEVGNHMCQVFRELPSRRQTPTSVHEAIAPNPPTLEGFAGR